MKLTDDEIIAFGAMMFAGGLNYAQGKNVDELTKISAEQFKRAKATAQVEYPKFKSEMKKRRTN